MRFTKRPCEAMIARSIAREWSDDAILAPDRGEPDPNHPESTRSYRAITPFGADALRSFAADVIGHQLVGQVLILVGNFEKFLAPFPVRFSFRRIAHLRCKGAIVLGAAEIVLHGFETRFRCGEAA